MLLWNDVYTTNWQLQVQSIFLCDCDRIEIIIQGLLKIYQHLAASKSGPVSFDSEVHILSAENTTVYKQEFLLEHSTFYYAGSRSCSGYPYPVYNKLFTGGRHDMPRPLLPRGRRSALRRRADGNVGAVSQGQHVPTPTTAVAWRATRRWEKRPGDLDLWPFDLESGVRVTCDVGYPCANFGLPRPLCSWFRPDVRDRRQTSDRCASSLNVPYPRGGGITISSADADKPERRV